MSKHWNPRVLKGGRRGRARHHVGVVRGRGGGSGSSIGLRDVWQTLVLGAVLGLVWLRYYGGEVALPDFGTAGGAMRVEDPHATRITDGDTFRYRGEKIRIADIDTPEVNGRCAYESKLAARATRRMEELLKADAFEMHRIGRDEDQYGRKLRVVTRDGRSLGDQLVAEGLARTWTGLRQPWCT